MVLISWSAGAPTSPKSLTHHNIHLLKGIWWWIVGHTVCLPLLVYERNRKSALYWQQSRKGTHFYTQWYAPTKLKVDSLWNHTATVKLGHDKPFGALLQDDSLWVINYHHVFQLLLSLSYLENFRTWRWLTFIPHLCQIYIILF